VIPWDTPHMDTTGPCKIEHKVKPELQLWAVTVIDPTADWSKTTKLPKTKRSDIAANTVEQQWLIRHPWPNEMVMVHGPKFMTKFKEMI